MRVDTRCASKMCQQSEATYPWIKLRACVIESLERSLRLFNLTVALLFVLLSCAVGIEVLLCACALWSYRLGFTENAQIFHYYTNARCLKNLSTMLKGCRYYALLCSHKKLIFIDNPYYNEAQGTLAHCALSACGQ